MAEANGLVEAMKRAALEAMESKKPVNVYFGKVMGVEPLSINVEQKMILGEKQLVLCRNVTDFKTLATVDWVSESSLSSHGHAVKGADSNGDGIDLATDKENLAHTHQVKGKKEIIIHNGLAVGEEVILLRQQEGQKFIVLDRIGLS